MLRGVEAVVPGYAGGKSVAEGAGAGADGKDRMPTYEEISRGDTGFAEVIKIDFEPAKIRYEDLLTVFFGSHDPTTMNRQGADIGTQYRSVIFYTEPEQKVVAEKFISELNASSPSGTPIVTEVSPLGGVGADGRGVQDGGKFYPAEAYHVDYYAKNQEAPYCQLVINPKLEKVQQKFADLLKEHS